MDETIRQLRDELTAAYSAFLAVAGQLPAEKRMEPGVCGEWTPKQVMDHLIGWDTSLKSLIVETDAFVPPEDVDQFNADSIAVRKQATWSRSASEIRSNFQELSQLLPTVQAEMPIYRHVVRWLPGRIADYQMHTSQLAAWL